MFVGTWLSGIVGEHLAVCDTVVRLRCHRRGPIWLIPVVMAAVVLILFAAVFHDDPRTRPAEAEAVHA